MGSKVCHCIFSAKSAHVAAVAAALICLVASATSCRVIKQIEYRTETEYIHDTTTIYVRDSIEKVTVRHDSIDRYIERIVYVDTNGVVHEKEIERLVKYINETNDEFYKLESEYKQRIRELETTLGESENVVEVKKPLNWFQKTFMVFGVCFIIVVAGYLISLYFKYFKKA